jgi:cobalt/nickel transport system permease protein
MGPSVHVLELPLKSLVLAAGGGIVLLALTLWLLRRAPSDKTLNQSPGEPDWSLPTIDSQAHLDSPFHRWDPRVKIVSLVFFMFCAASLTQLLWASLVLLGAVAAVGVACIPLRQMLRRLAGMAGFLGMFLLVMPITVPARSGDTLVVFNHLAFLPFNLRGFMLALLICLKASGIAVLVEPLLATAPFSVTVQALGRLRIPSMVCQMILLAHRYIFVFQHESARMIKGMWARGFRKRTNVETLRTLGNFLGMLLVRSFERTQRVYQAMLARGYSGKLAAGVDFHAGAGDWFKGACWVLAGLVIACVDRIWTFPAWWLLK